METFEIYLRAGITVLAVTLFLISMMAYSRERDRRLLLVSIAFTIFMVKGIILTIGIFSYDVDQIVAEYWFHVIFDLAILVFLFAGSWRKRGRGRSWGERAMVDEYDRA